MVRSRASRSPLEEGEIGDSPPRKASSKKRASKTPSPPVSRKSSAAKSPTKDSPPAKNTRARAIADLPRIPKKELTAAEQAKRTRDKAARDRIKARTKAREDARKPPPPSQELTRGQKAARTRALKKEAAAKMAAAKSSKKTQSKSAAAAKKPAATAKSGRTTRSSAPPTSPKGTAAGGSSKTGRVTKTKASSSKGTSPTKHERDRAMIYRATLVGIETLLGEDDRGAFHSVRANLQSAMNELEVISKKGRRATRKDRVIESSNDDEDGGEEAGTDDEDDDDEYDDENEL